ncbi:MAG TPA: S8 family serine peptidase [Acidimicrobiia bacterium]|nr:S8 family serine peptidase [Acidimicrobiia bacterium]
MRTRIVALALAPLTAVTLLAATHGSARADTAGMWVYFHLADGASVADVEATLTTMEAAYPDYLGRGWFVPLDVSGLLAYIPQPMAAAAGVNAAAPTVPGTACATDDATSMRFFPEIVRWSMPWFQGIAETPNPGSYDPAADAYSPYNLAKYMRADAFWAGGYRGKTTAAAAYPYTNQIVPAGTPVDVALIDTGVSPVGAGGQAYPKPLGTVSGLDGVSVVQGPDFSFESQSPDLAHLDAYGHGTAMAGIIHTVAPDARIVNLKVADATGAADPTQVIAAVDWAREHRNRFGLNIRVINLSYGVLSNATWQNDELSKAVDRAWQDGIVVVVAAGNYNDDPASQTYGVASPAVNKNMLAVSAYDSTGPKGTPTDFSNTTGANARIPDVAAPGAHATSWRVAGAQADNAIAQAMCDLTPSGKPAQSYPIFYDAAGHSWVRGSGTSQATAFASGAAALMLSRWPDLKPDELKYTPKAKAVQLSGGTRNNFGDGGIDLGTTGVYGAVPAYDWSYKFGTVTGGASIENSRGGYHLWDEKGTRWLETWVPLICAIYYPSGGCPPIPDPYTYDFTACGLAPNSVVPNAQPLCGDKDIFGKAFSSPAHATLANNDKTWTDATGTWNGSTWIAPPAANAAGQTVGFLTDASTGQLVWPTQQWSPAQNWAGTDFGWNTNWSGSRWVGSRWVGSRWVAGSWSSAGWR